VELSPSDLLPWLPPAAAAGLILAGGAWLLRRAGLRRRGIGEIDRMDGEAFERRLEALFRTAGCAVERTRCRGDFGADLLVTRDGARTAVQAKRSGRRVGVRAVQEVVSARSFYGCDGALVVTNACFTAPAIRLAAANGVELWDRGRLIRALLRPEAGAPAAAPAADSPAPREASPRGGCATCGEPLAGRDLQHARARAFRLGGRLYCRCHLPRGS